MVNATLPSDFDINNFREILEYFRQLSKEGVNGIIEDWLLNMLEWTIPYQANFWYEEKFPRIERITINKRILNENKRIDCITHLKYPPSELVTKYSRCNLPGESVFYGTFNPLTALAEMRPEKGDMITRSIWRCNSDKQLKYCPIFYHQPTSGEVVNPRSRQYKFMFEQELKKTYSDPDIREFIIELNKFISEQFSKPINSGNHRDYIFSSFFSSKILNEMENGSIEAIHYPSVKEDLSLDNLAIKPDVFDKYFQLIEVSESIVQSTPTSRSSGHVLHATGDTKKFDYSSDKIIWD